MANRGYQIVSDEEKKRQQVRLDKRKKKLEFVFQQMLMFAAKSQKLPSLHNALIIRREHT